MTPQTLAAQSALTALQGTLEWLEQRLGSLADAALRFDVAEVIALTAAIDRAQDEVQTRQLECARTLSAAQEADPDGARVALRSLRVDVRARAVRLQDVQRNTRQIVERARSFAAAHARALVTTPAPTVGYSRRGAAAAPPALAGALHDATV
jgi:hypothetical protein